MKEHYYLENCNDNDVLSYGDIMFKVRRFKEAIKTSFENEIPNFLENKLKDKLAFQSYLYTHLWFGKDNNNSQTWEILKLGANNWQKGKIRVRVSVEFVPDEPDNLESPLDDIRKIINE